MNCVVAKANRMLGLIKRTCKGLNDLKTLRTLNCSLVSLTLNTALWNGPLVHVRTLTSLTVSRDETFFFFKSGLIYSVSLKITSFDHT